MGSHSLTDSERADLLRLARHALVEWLGGTRRRYGVSSRLTTEKRGVFVTLRLLGELRGCIGYIEPQDTISETVRRLTVKAASEDPRFPPVVPGEADTLRIEISVLSPLSACDDIRRIEIGRHGLVVEQGWKRGLLLPEVALDAGWDAETFVRQCCVKAGLTRSAWNEPGTRVWTFESEHFGEPLDVNPAPDAV